MTHDTPTTHDAAASPPQPLDIFKRHRIDQEAAENGVWITIRGDRFLVYRAGGKRNAKARADFLALHALPPDADVPRELATDFSAFVFARAVLGDVRFQAHPDVKYEPSIGERIYRDADLADVRADIVQRSMGDFTKEGLAYEASLGNLQPYSNGSTSAAPSLTR